MKTGDLVRMPIGRRKKWDHLGIVVAMDGVLVCVHWDNRRTWVGKSQLEVLNESR